MGYNKLTRLFLVLSALFYWGCTEEVAMPEISSSSKLVVDAWITDKGGPYQVKLTRSLPFKSLASGVNYTYEEGLNLIGIPDAQVTISDNTGFEEVLKKEPNNTYGYVTTNLVGKAGRTYYLKIKLKGQEYTATAYMPPVPKIDKVSYFFRPTEIVGKEDSYVPLVYFQEPTHEKNYYLFKYCYQDWCGPINGGSTGGRNWNVSIMNDDLMPAYVNGLSIDDGHSVSGMDFYPFSGVNTLQMYSLTKEGYQHFDALIRQFLNDGGTYQPAPASAPGNISNGALGFFGAAAVSEMKVHIP